MKPEPLRAKSQTPMPQSRRFPLSRDVRTGITNHHRLMGLPRDTEDGNTDYKQLGRGPFTYFRHSSSILFHTLQTSSQRNKPMLKSPCTQHNPKPGAGAANKPPTQVYLEGLYLHTSLRFGPRAVDLATICLRRILSSLGNQGWDCTWQGEIAK